MCTHRCHIGSSFFCFSPALVAECSPVIMETLRQDLVQATCKWLESVIHWDGIAETERTAYGIQCEVKERDAFNEAYRSRLYSQSWQQRSQAREDDFPENLRAVHRAHETLAQARDTRGRMFEAYSKAKFAQADVISPLVGLQLQRNALYQVQKVFREFPNDLDAMWTALSKARAAGVASRKHIRRCAGQMKVSGSRFQECHQLAISGREWLIHRDINFSSTTLWSESFGPMIADKFWGIRSWEGFAYPVMTAYCQKWHLDIADFRRGMFTAPVPLARHICWERELTDQNSKEADQFPCFFTCTRQHQGSSLSWSACFF